MTGEGVSDGIGADLVSPFNAYMSTKPTSPVENELSEE